jgi:multiple antibiotic resistance protein
VTLYTAALTLFLVMDPLGAIPVFVSVLDRVPPKRRKLVILRETFVAFAILVGFLFGGRYVLAGLHIGDAALQIAGGVVLFLIAIGMVFPRQATAGHTNPEEPLIVPLAVPLLAGPSSMAFVILLASQYPARMLHWLAALAIAWFAGSAILLFADVLRRFLGRRFLIAVERLMGMILITVSVQMLLSGIRDYASTL